MKKLILLLCGMLVIFGLTSNTRAASIDVLWYGGSSSYNTAMETFATGASSWDPWSDGSLNWNLTFWNSGDPTPVFSSYDALVIGSPAYGFDTGMDPARLLAAKTAIEAARGNRTFLSGQDADWHAQYGLTAAEGFIFNAVNWAASGTGTGIVSMTDGWSGSGSQWWLDNDSFLKDELTGFVSYFQEESVVIPPATAGFPVNEGLTTASLSNWGTSSHAGFDKTIPGYLSINDAGNLSGFAVTIVTEGQAGGGTGGGTVVPEPCTCCCLVQVWLVWPGLDGRSFPRKAKKDNHRP
jgi:hypothetical protein